MLTIPNIDLGGKIRVIDDSGLLPKWQTIATLTCASVENARRVAKRYNLTTFWLFDDLGNKQLITGESD